MMTLYLPVSFPTTQEYFNETLQEKLYQYDFIYHIYLEKRINDYRCKSSGFIKFDDLLTTGSYK